MNADLERVIALQRLDSTAHDAQRRLTDEPERTKALDTRLETARQHVASAKERLAENQNARRAIEKDVAVHQGRLSKFREQAMAVKTNQEYHAVQHEIGYAQTEIKTLEDKILEGMLEADELTALVKRTEKELADEQKAVDADRKAMTAEHGELQASLERIAAERSTLVAALDPQVLAIFELIAKRRNGIASPKRATASARSATSVSGRRSSTPSAATIRSCSATAATGSSTSCPRPRSPRRRSLIVSESLRSRGHRVHRRRRAG
jgi:predicted  nucleic acid-binding Zn-ribbon protein